MTRETDAPIIDIPPGATASPGPELPADPHHSWQAVTNLLDNIHCEATSFYYATYTAPWSLQSMGPREVLSYLIEQGGAVLDLAGARFELDVGDLLVIPHGTRHRLSCRDNSNGAELGHANLRIDTDRAAPLLRMLPVAIVFRGENGQVAAWLRPMIQLINQLRDASDAGDQAIVRRFSEAAIIRAIQEYLHYAHVRGGALSRSQLFRIAPAVRAIHHAPDRKWSVAALARESGMSRTVFATSFTEAMGEPPAQYLLNVRMAMAQELLRTSPLPLSDVAYRVGYANEGALARAFKRRFGLSPVGFRNAQTDDPD
ncbi:AraC family transcriptional regulator [Actibacterium sp. D379-3]